MASFNASRRESASSVFEMRHASALRVCYSIMEARYRNPRRIGRYMMFKHQTWFSRPPSAPSAGRDRFFQPPPVCWLWASDRSASTPSGASAGVSVSQPPEGRRCAGARSFAGHPRTGSPRTVRRSASIDQGSALSRHSPCNIMTSARTTAACSAGQQRVGG